MKSDLTREQLATAVHYSPETGVFTRRSTGKEVGAPNEHGYLYFGVNGGRYRAHRLAWLYVYGEWPTGELDHENLQRADNRISNLRQATRRQNKQNMTKARSDSRSGLLGVETAPNGRFKARIRTSTGARMNLGTFDSAEQAHAAYLAAKAIEHPFAVVSP